jgi:Fe2+ transport system protein B
MVEFLKKAGTTILVVSVVVWALSYFPDGRVETSFLAQVGRLLAPVGGNSVALLSNWYRRRPRRWRFR